MKEKCWAEKQVQEAHLKPPGPSMRTNRLGKEQKIPRGERAEKRVKKEKMLQ